MAKIKLTKSAVDTAQPQAQAVELRDTVVPGLMCKGTPAGRKVFMLQYRTYAGKRRTPALGLYGELTVAQARALAQEWMAEVRQGADPSAARPLPAAPQRSRNYAASSWRSTPSSGTSPARKMATGASSTATSFLSWVESRCRTRSAPKWPQR